MKTRIYFLDNLRTVLIFLVVLLHAGLVYESVLVNSWIVSDPAKSNAIGLIRLYLDLFVMFCIFFISGYFVSGSVDRQTGWQFVRSKLKRILIPWGVAVCTLIPAYKFIFLYSRGLSQEEWFSYFHFYERTGSDLRWFANDPGQSWLWFLPVLFAFQLLYLVFRKLHVFSFSLSLRQGIVLTFVVSVAYSLFLSFNRLTGWTHSFLFDFQNERLVVYLSAFLLGSLCAKLRIFDTWKRSMKQMIGVNIGLALSVGIYTVTALNFFFNLLTPGRAHFFISEGFDRIVYYSSAVCSMLCLGYVLLDVFRFRLNKTNVLWMQLGRFSYAVYVIHVVVLGMLALVLLKLDVSPWVKFVLLTIATFTLSNFLVYACQQSFQRTFNLKTATTFALTLVLLVVAFSGHPVIPDAKTETQATERVTDIHTAVILGNLEAVKYLITNGTDINDAEAEGGSSPLISAALFGKTEIARFLIESGADLNFRNNDGSTALHTAAFLCRSEIVTLLLENGADPALRNQAGSTAYESVAVPFDAVKGIYMYLASVYAPLGLQIDPKQIELNRPVIAAILFEKEEPAHQPEQ